MSENLENLNHLRRYLDRQIAEADKLNFDLSNYEEVAQKTEILLTHSKKNTLVEIGQKQKDLMLQELNKHSSKMEERRGWMRPDLAYSPAK